ncbi:Ribosomal biogenesis protein las1l [Phytophthora pseudosyringae]|uniref:Ribosomal biogenesis protein las1l n=1 Tax=Phytophthora pseudosyringae TaxID=221518 RepID=A0A8T1W244_9STRA|nr:Ribosomal biogenesis protein las1l [Phytophthora pseudosyringae]
MAVYDLVEFMLCGGTGVVIVGLLLNVLNVVWEWQARESRPVFSVDAALLSVQRNASKRMAAEVANLTLLRSPEVEKLLDFRANVIRGPSVECETRNDVAGRSVLSSPFGRGLQFDLVPSPEDHRGRCTVRRGECPECGWAAGAPGLPATGRVRAAGPSLGPTDMIPLRTAWHRLACAPWCELRGSGLSLDTFAVSGSHLQMSGRKNAQPWLDWAEWQEAHVGLFSSDPYAQQRAVSRVASWRSRAQLPVAISATAQLVELQLHESVAQHHHHAVGVSSRSHMELSLLYASVVVRCVNGLVDGSQKGAYALAVSTLAQRIGIPLWVVDLRHESTHNQLPSLPVLRFAARHLLAWLRANYWGAQEDSIRHQVHHVAQWLFDQLPHLNKQTGDEEMQADSAQDTQAPKLTVDADHLRNIVVPMLVAGEQYSERVAPTGLLFLGAPPLPEDRDAKDAAETFQKEAFITLLLRLQPLWRSFSASLLARICRKVFDAICPSKSRRGSVDEEDLSAQEEQAGNAFQTNEVDMALQWIKFMVSSEYRERVKLQIGPIEDLCQCGAEMLALAEKLKPDDAEGTRAELLERLLTALRSSKGVRNHSTLATEAAIATTLAAESESGWRQLPAWVESPLGLRHCYTSCHSSNQSQVSEYSLDDDMLMPDSMAFVAPDEEDEEDSNNADPDDAEKAMDALMEDLDAAYEIALRRNLDLQAVIARDGLRQGGSTTVLPQQELQRIQEEIEIW